MIKLSSWTQQLKLDQNNSKNKQDRLKNLHCPRTQSKQTKNPSISLQNRNYELNSSISEKIFNYTNEPKNYLISKLSKPQNQNQNQKKSFKDKMRTQSSKNVQKQKDSKIKQNKSAKSAKHVKISSRSSTSQFLYIQNDTFANQFNQKQKVQDHLKLTSLSKIVQKTQKQNKMKPRHSSQVFTDMERRLSKLESLVQTLLDQKTVNYINLKGNSLPSFKQPTKPVIRRKPLINAEKKNYLSLVKQTEKQDNLSKNKIQKKVDLTKNSSKMLQDSKIKRNFKENQLPVHTMKKSNLKLNNNYNPVLDYNMKSSKKVLFIKSKVESNKLVLDEVFNKLK